MYIAVYIHICFPELNSKLLLLKLQLLHKYHEHNNISKFINPMGASAGSVCVGEGEGEGEGEGKAEGG